MGERGGERRRTLRPPPLPSLLPGVLGPERGRSRGADLAEGGPAVAARRMDGREESAPAPVLPPGGRGGDSAAGERSGSSYLQPQPVVTSMEEQPEVSQEEPEEVKTEKSSEDNHWHSRSYTLGAISSFLSTFVTFPIYKLVFRQQIHAVSVPQAVNQLHQEGPCRFYRGIYPPLLAKTLQGTLLFGTHNNLLQALSPTGHSRLWQRWVAGSLSGVVEAVVLTPFERVQNVLQDGRKDARFPSTSSILQEFNSYSFWERLAMGYYRGFFPILLRNSLGSALYFSFKDPIRDSLTEQGLPSWVPALVSGSVNGTLTCLLLYPLSVLVANMQSQVGWQEAPGLRASAQAVWEDRGRKLSLLYRGGSLVILRSCVTWGLTTAIHDFLQESNRPKVEESD